MIPIMQPICPSCGRTLRTAHSDPKLWACVTCENSWPKEPYWYAVTCRICGDDEDSCIILQAESRREAIYFAERQLRERRGYEDLDDTMPAVMPEGWGDDPGEDTDEQDCFYLNYVLRCDSEPTMEMDNVNNR